MYKLDKTVAPCAGSLLRLFLLLQASAFWASIRYPGRQPVQRLVLLLRVLALDTPGFSDTPLNHTRCTPILIGIIKYMQTFRAWDLVYIDRY